jgi:hypothetical protein
MAEGLNSQPLTEERCHDGQMVDRLDTIQILANTARTSSPGKSCRNVAYGTIKAPISQAGRRNKKVFLLYFAASEH